MQSNNLTPPPPHTHLPHSEETDTLTCVNLREFSWFKTGGTASEIHFPRNIRELSQLIRKLNSENRIFKIIGETTNLIFLDGKDYGTFISTTRLKQITHHPETTEFEVETGYLLPDLSRYALDRSIKGFAGFEGIPGTIGGAVFMNASAYGHRISQVLKRVEVIMPDGRIDILEANQLEFNHRDSVFKKGTHPGIVSKAFFSALPGNRAAIYRKMEDSHARRHRSFEYMYPNLGSIFAGSVYRSMGRKDIVFRFLTALFYFFGYQLKSIGKETPLNRKWINDIAVKRFGLRFNNQPFSDKSLNVLINNGHHTDELVAYIRKMQDIIGTDVPIENEIVEPF